MNTTTVPRFYFALCFLLLAGCTTIPDKTPEWVLFPERTYAPAEYLFAMGSGPTGRIAKKEAVQRLNQLFELRMDEADQLTVQTYRQLGFPAGFRPVFSETAPESKERPSLSRIRTGKSSADREGNHRVLVYISRAETARPVIARLEKGASDTRRLLAQAKAAPEPFSRFASQRAALLRALQTEKPAAQAALLYPAAVRGFNLGYTISDVLDGAANDAQAVTFRTDITGDSGDIIKKTVENTLRGIGFVPAADGLLTVTGSISTSLDRKHEDQNARAEYHLRLRVQDHSGKTLAQIDTSKTEQFPLMEAEVLASRSVQQTILTELRKEVIDALNRSAGVN
ncbi:MAG: hypothetical protein AB7E95_01780 [Kiritimatiellales bacterium]